VVLFLLAVAAVTATVNVTVALFWLATIGRGIAPYSIDGAGNVALAVARVPPALFAWTTAVTLAVIATRSLVTVYAMRGGGDAVARMVGGVPLERGTADPAERRLLNVVDEMAIASGVTVPRVYVLRGEPGLNAFAAGYAPNQAALAVTEGALRQLTRDELQGVVGHEFSHVLNGDMRLNVRMIGVLAGILCIGEVGEFLMRSAGGGRGSRRGNRSAVILLGVALMVIGYVGLFFGRLVRAAVSRQRELLGDASSVQFTRNPRGLAGALAVIGAAAEGSLVRDRHAETLSHMFFAEGVKVWLGSVLATHPPVAERIRRIDPRFAPAEYLRTRTTAAPPPAGAAPAHRAAPTVAPPVASRPAAVLVDSVGRPTPAHVDHAARLLAALPPALHAAAEEPAAAQALLLAFALAPDEADRKRQVALLEQSGRDALAQRADALAGAVRTLSPVLRLPVVAIALATLRELEQPARDALVSDLVAAIEADRHLTLDEFVLLTIVRQQLGASAARPEPVAHRSIFEVTDDARVVLALLAHTGAAGPGEARAAFERGTQALRLPAAALPPSGDVALARVGDSFDRLRRLAPFVKRLFLESCVETVTADDTLGLAEAELLRAIAAALDCPVPPILGAVPLESPARA
jgi:Zn-dependent protease with chaperone function